MNGFKMTQSGVLLKEFYHNHLSFELTDAQKAQKILSDLNLAAKNNVAEEKSRISSKGLSKTRPLSATSSATTQTKQCAESAGARDPKPERPTAKTSTTSGSTRKSQAGALPQTEAAKQENTTEPAQ